DVRTVECTPMRVWSDRQVDVGCRYVGRFVCDENSNIMVLSKALSDAERAEPHPRESRRDHVGSSDGDPEPSHVTATSDRAVPTGRRTWRGRLAESAETSSICGPARKYLSVSP